MYFVFSAITNTNTTLACKLLVLTKKLDFSQNITKSCTTVASTSFEFRLKGQVKY
jgi:hypothetical protein